jgi:oxygen-independent coproporphyrinogen-3 oxidase
MIETFLKEIQLRRNYLPAKNLKSIYFGGGTPSMLNEDELTQLLNEIQTYFALNEGIEITLEANPDDISQSKLIQWKKLGINRLSIGLQSFKSADLRWMNRTHSAEESLNCVLLAKQHGFENISVDLMYGLPGLSSAEWRQHIQTVIDFGVQHVSAYCLTVEEKTKLHKMVSGQELIPSDEDEQSEQFLLLTTLLSSAGFQHYEISNFGLPGFEAIHNTNYWKGEHYLGIGPSAHSFNGISRRWNIANNQQYMQHVGMSETWYEEEQLSPKEHFNELILTGLRTIYGVNLEKLNSLHKLPKIFETTTKTFKENGWLFFENGHIKLTTEGKLKADYIASALFIN